MIIIINTVFLIIVIIVVIIGNDHNYCKHGPERTLLISNAGGSLDYVVMLHCVCCPLLALRKVRRVSCGNELEKSCPNEAGSPMRGT